MAQTFSFPNYGLFNATYYLQQNPDVATSWTGTPLQHYISFGALEGRAPTAWFNADFYRQAYTDLQSMNALQLFNHYCNYGYNEGRVPMLNFSNFNGARYLLDNPDVAAAGYTAANAISHFVNYGEYEGRVAYADNGVVIQPVVNEGDVYTLTTGVDFIDGTQFNDTFNANLGGASVNVNTLNPLDQLDGMGGTDTLNATLATSVSPADLSNIEVFNVESTSTGTVTLNLANAGQETTITNVGSAATGTLAITNISATGVNLGVQDTSGDTQFVYASTTGTQSVNLDLTNAGTSTDTAGVTIAGVETIAISSNGSTANIVNLNAGAATTVTIDGDNDLALAGAAVATLIDGTDMTGDLTAALTVKGVLNGGFGNDTLTGGDDVKATISGGAGNDAITAGAAATDHADSMSGGLGNDTFTFASGLVANTNTASSNDSIDGGLGIDTLVSTSGQFDAINNTPSDAIQSISNIEAITVSDATGLAHSLTLARIQTGINTVNLTGATSSVKDNQANTITFDATVDAATVNLAATIGTTNATTLGVTAAGTGTVDALTLANSNTAAANVDVFNGQTVTLTGFESATINVGSYTTNVSQDIGTLNLNGSNTNNVSVALTGSNSASIAVLNTNTIGNVTVDASGLTGTTGTVFTYDAGTLGGAASTESITGSGGNDDIDVKNYASTVHAGAGNDTIAGGTKADEIHGEAGNDTLVGGGGNDTIHGGDGNDTIDATAAGTVSITGGAGDDKIYIGDTLTTGDVIDGGTGTNMLDISTALVADYAPITNIQTLQISGNLTQDASKFTGTTITQVNFLNDNSRTATVNNLTAEGITLALLGGGSTTNYTVDHATTDTTSDALTIGALLDATTSVTAFTDNDVETLTVGSGNTTIARDFTITTLTASDLVTLNLVNAGNFTTTLAAQTVTPDVFSTLSAAANNGTVNFSATNATGVNLTLTGASAYENQLTGGDGNDTITGGSANDTLVGNAGADSITAGAGNDKVTGDTGADLINVGTGTDQVLYNGTGETMAQTTSFATFASVATGSVIDADVITGMGNGDLLDLTGAYTVASGTTVATSVGALADVTADTFALVSGNFNALTGTFIAGAASTTNNDFVFQWADGTRVNSVVLQDVWTTGSAVTITLAATTDTATLGGIA